MARILDGRVLSRRIQEQLRARLQDMDERPGLAVVLVGDDPASEVYVARKQKACQKVGIETQDHRLPGTVSEDDLLALIDGLNAAPETDGILVQLPLPAHIDKDRVLQRILPGKDVDAFHPESVGHALLGNEAMAPCTPYGILLLLDEAGIDVKGAEVVIINHSNLIGKPLAALLINRHATVTVCHVHTKDLAAHTRGADIVVTATGVEGLLRADMIREGAVVIDAGIVRREDGTLCGDAAADVANKAAWITPVPGGVGPMTIAVLLQNTVRAFEGRRAS